MTYSDPGSSDAGDSGDASDVPNQWYGCVADLPDHRDLVFQIPPSTSNPAFVNLRNGFPLPPFDQGELGSCTANAVAGIITFDQNKQGLPSIMPSRLFQYYNSRKLEGTVRSDAGATIRDSIKAYNKNGECPETDWPYVISKFAKRPPVRAFSDAGDHKPLKYNRVAQVLANLKAALVAGYPIIIGFTVYESFESDEVAQTGDVPYPANAESALGGHAVIVCGYDDASQRFMCRNSWGTGWGDGGYFTIGYDYLTNSDLAADFWVVQVIR